MPRIFELLDSLEGMGRDEIMAEIEVCERRIMWCKVFLEMIDKGITYTEQTEQPTVKITGKRARDRVAAGTFAGEIRLWSRLRDYMQQHGGNCDTNFLAEQVGVSYGAVYKALNSHSELFVRHQGLWSLKEQMEQTA